MSTTLILLIIAAVIAVAVLLAGRRGRTAPGVEQADVNRAKELAGDPAVTLLDVRTAQEFREGHLRNARNIPLAELGRRIDELASVKGRRILVYCLAGGRSAAACGILQKGGFSKLANLQGGIRAWIGAGFSVQR